MSYFTGWRCLGDVTRALEIFAPFSPQGTEHFPATWQLAHLSVRLSHLGFASRNITISLKLVATAFLLFCQWCHCCTTRFVFFCSLEETAVRVVLSIWKAGHSKVQVDVEWGQSRWGWYRHPRCPPPPVLTCLLAVLKEEWDCTAEDMSELLGWACVVPGNCTAHEWWEVGVLAYLGFPVRLPRWYWGRMWWVHLQ